MGDTALHCACRDGKSDLVSLLLENRASISAQNNVSETASPFYVYRTSAHLHPDCALQMGMSPLHEAAQAGHVAVVRKLLECGADPQLKRVVSALAAQLVLPWLIDG